MNFKKMIGRVVLMMLVILLVGLWLGYSPLEIGKAVATAATFGFGMAALAADRVTAKKMTLVEKSYLMKGSTKIYAGGFVGVDVNGFALPAADAANVKTVGIAKSTVDNTAGADGAASVNVEEGLFLMDATSITQAMVGQVMYIVDDHTFDDALGTNGVKAGRLLEYVSATSGWILVKPSGLGIVTADGSDATTTQALANAIKANLNKWQL